MTREEEDPKSVLAEYYSRGFGVRKSFFDGLEAIQKKSGIWVSSPVLLPPMFESVGMPALRRFPGGYKPTTFFLVFLGDEVRNRRVELSEKELFEILSGREIERDTGERGFVALCFEGRVVGCGFSTGTRLRSMIPKARAGELLEALSRG